MKRKRKEKQPTDKTVLAQKLENGDPIVGMKGYVRAEDYDNPNVYIKIEVLGLDTSDGCGLSVKVKPVSGQGEFTISPCQWLDSPADIAEQEKAREKRERAREDYCKVWRYPNYLKHRRAKLQEYVEENMTTEQLEDFIENALEYTKQKGNELLYSKLDGEQLKYLSKAAIAVVNELTAVDREEVLR